MRILCYRNIRVPSTTAHSLYGVQTCALVSRRVPVCLVAARGERVADFRRFYGFDPADYPQLSVRTPWVRHKGLSGLWRRSFARRWLGRPAAGTAVVYVSQVRPARHFARLKDSGRYRFSLIVECHSPDEGWGDELHSADGMIYTSEALRRVMVERYPQVEAKPSLISHHKVDGLPPPPPRDAFRSAGDRFLLCYVGSILPWKDLGCVVEAMRRLPERFHLRIVGGHEGELYRGELIRRSRDLGLASRTEFLPFQPREKLAALCEEADALLLPLCKTERYRIPFKLLEYLAYARPVVAADLDCVRDLLRDGQNSLLYEPESAVSLAARIRTLASMSPDERRGLVCGGLETAQPFTAEGWSKRFLDWLTGVVERPGRSAAA